MSGLAGEAFVAIWHDVVPEGKANYYEWHNREHMPERVGIPGFIRGRRYIAEKGMPEYFNLYEVETVEVLTGREYLERLNNPTPLTRRTVTHLRNVARSLCRVARSVGCAEGGVIMTWQLEALPGREDALRDYLQKTFPSVFARPGVVGAHFGISDRAGSEIMSEERKARGSVMQVPGLVILVEGVSGAAVQAAGEPELEPSRLRSHGAADQIQTGIYRLQTSLVKTAVRGENRLPRA